MKAFLQSSISLRTIAGATAVLLVLGGISSFAQDQKKGEQIDYTKVDRKELGVEPFKPVTEKSGFIVGGKNKTETIRGLKDIAGRTIAELETDMRPNQFSTAGFLGKDEKLLDVLAADNQLVVEKWGKTHQELAGHLHVLGAIARKNGVKAPYEFRYRGRKWQAKAVLFRGTVNSPFEDGTKTNCEAELKNLDTGKTLKFSLIIPHLIERYGFYEGKGTRYRVPPEAIVETLDFLK